MTVLGPNDPRALKPVKREDLLSKTDKRGIEAMMDEFFAFQAAACKGKDCECDRVDGHDHLRGE